MRVLGIIPARKGSKRIANKNSKLLDGKPLIEYVIEASLNSELISDIVLTTDSEEIIEIGKKYSRLEVLRRPDALADDTSPAIDYVNHALHHVTSTLNRVYDIVVILQPTSPLTISADIDNTIAELMNSDADSSVSVVKLNHQIHPFKLKIMEGSVLKPYIEEERGRMAAHEMPTVYVRNGAVYASKVSVIARGIIIGEVCIGYEMPESRSVDINDPIDFEFAEFLLKRKSTNLSIDS